MFTRRSADMALQRMERARSELTTAMLAARRRFGEQLPARRGFSSEGIASDERMHRSMFADLHTHYFDTLADTHLSFRPGRHAGSIEGAPALDVASQAAYLAYSLHRAELLNAAQTVAGANNPRVVVTAYRRALLDSAHFQRIMGLAIQAHESLPTAMIEGLGRGSSYLGYLQDLKTIRDLREIRRKLEP